MRPTFALLFLLFFLAFPAFSQVKIIGPFAIGDTTQTHVLHSKRNDRFVGRVMGWSTDSLTFLTEGGIPLAFPLSELSRVEVSDNQFFIENAVEVFVLKTTDGSVFQGFPKFISEKNIIFKTSKARTVRLKPEDVVSMELEETFARNVAPFNNEYSLVDSKGILTECELVRYGEGQLFYQTRAGGTKSLPVQRVRKFDHLKSREPFLGNGRSLMLSPTGFNLKKGQMEFRNIEYGINTFAYGFSDHFSIGGGLVSFLPYIDAKFAQDFGKYVHVSAGGFASPLMFGGHASLSLGTPDYFINLAYLKSGGIGYFDTEFRFEGSSFGASVRTGRRSRLFGEFLLLTEKVDPEIGEFYNFYNRGYGNAFTLGYGYFNKSIHFETGLVALGPYESSFCFPGPCNAYYVPIPLVAFGINF
ncbi:MAG: hypothetical protein HY842_18255 [Bacteroidetes bacterium]|nr:hypothetical protein [Bacteroidota bacterium]